MLLTNAISIFDILNSNEAQNRSGEAVLTIHKMFKIMLKSRCLQKSKIVDWMLRVGMGGEQACCMWGPGHSFCADSVFIDYCTLNIKKAGQLVK